MGFAMLQLIGQCGPLVGTRLYPEEDAPLYITGMAACMGAMILVAVLAFVLRIYLGWKNRKTVGEEAEYSKIGDEGHGLVGGPRSRRKDPFKYLL